MQYIYIYPGTFLDHKEKKRNELYITEGRGIQFEDGEDERLGRKPVVGKTAERSLRDFVRNNHQTSLTHNNVA